MSDVVVTVPKWFWPEWIKEGQLPGEPDMGEDWHFYLYGARPAIKPGERVYVVAHGKLRGYAPLVRIDSESPRSARFALVRNGGATAVTIDEPIRGFRGWRERWWDRDIERPFPDWQQTYQP
jgi:hypothetical protein